LIGPVAVIFYNKETGEFDHYSEFADPEKDDRIKFEDDCWIAAPDEYDIRELDIMADFAGSVADYRKGIQLREALDGDGAFRRFRVALKRVGLEGEWYAFRRGSFVDIARRWCMNNDIPFDDPEKYPDPNREE